MTIQADLVDQALSDRVLEILRPEQVEIALRAVKELERRSQAVDQQWRMRIERLEYQAQLAQRRYEEVDPSNRLVAGTLERRWNNALVELNTAQEELHRSRQQQGLELTEEQKAQLRALAEDLPLPAPDKVRYPEALVNRVRSLAASMTDAQITATLNQEGLLSAKGKPFTPSMVSWIRYRYDIPAPSLKQAKELTVGEVADHFQVSPGVVYYWIDRGHLPARRLGPGRPYWITLEAEKEIELHSWVTNSNRINPSQVQLDTARGAI